MTKEEMANTYNGDIVEYDGQEWIVVDAYHAEMLLKNKEEYHDGRNDPKLVRVSYTDVAYVRSSVDEITNMVIAISKSAFILKVLVNDVINCTREYDYKNNVVHFS